VVGEGAGENELILIDADEGFPTHGRNPAIGYITFKPLPEGITFITSKGEATFKANEAVTAFKANEAVIVRDDDTANEAVIVRDDDTANEADKAVDAYEEDVAEPVKLPLMETSYPPPDVRAEYN
jgi:hypothetical protein